MHIAKLVVVGAGLMGSSCALALRAAGAVAEVVGIGRSQANLGRALARGAIDRARTLGEDWTAELTDADMVLVAIPVAQCGGVFAAMSGALGPGAVLTDAGSTKRDVVAAARENLGPALPRFVPAHPITGSERSGAEAADASLYVGRQVVLTPLPETAPGALVRVEEFWTTCGARVSRLDPERHDRILAAVSHLPHLLAFLLVAELESRPDGAEYLGNAGGGFRDFTRIAASSSEMWRDITLANRDALLTEIAAYRNALDALALSIEHRDVRAIDALITRAANARRRWGASGIGAFDAAAEGR